MNRIITRSELIDNISMSVKEKFGETKEVESFLLKWKRTIMKYSEPLFMEWLSSNGINFVKPLSQNKYYI